MAEDRKKTAGRRAAKDLATGKAKPSSIGAKARAAAAKLKAAGGSDSKPAPKKETAPAKKPSEGYVGKHRAAPNAKSTMKNARGRSSDPSIGKHSTESSAGRKVQSAKGTMSMKEAMRAKRKFSKAA